MPFVLIKGRFVPRAGQPDGDSVRFRADDPTLWLRLEGLPVELSTGGATAGTVQLRFEGIDAIEKAAIQSLAAPAKLSMLNLIGFSETIAEPRGYVLARMTDDKTRRPICFAFVSTPPNADGSEVFLAPAMLRDSVNWRQMEAGFAYPLYYNTLFASLRRAFGEALERAQADGRGYWPHDRTREGVTVTHLGDLATIPPIWPKLWRRLQEYLRTHDTPDEFIAFLAAKNERVDILSEMDERGLQDLVAVDGDHVRLTEDPANLRVRGQAGLRG
jgi:endonuclease YncB( thermonuclease family)